MNKNHHVSTLVVALASMLFTSLFVSADPITELNEYEFQASSGDQLIVSVRDADITIQGEKGRTSVSIAITKSIKQVDPGNAQEVFDLYAIECTQEDGMVRIESIPFDQSLYRQLKKLFKGLHIKVEVLVPEESEIQAKTSDGDISLVAISGKVNLKTSDGDLAIENIDGPLTANTSDGDIFLKEITGDVDVKTSDGDLMVTNIDGNLQAKTSDGDIHVTGLKGNLDAKTSDGDIQATGVAGALDLKTSDGDISASISQTPPSDCSMATSDGSISLSVADDVSADFNIRGNDGEISFTHPAATITKLQKHAITARINDGGIMIDMKTSDGDISVHN